MPRGFLLCDILGISGEMLRCVCRPGADDVLVLHQELVKTQTLMDAVNQDHDKERDHLTAELSDVRHKLQLYVFDFDLTFTRLDSDLSIFYLHREQFCICTLM